MSMDDWGRKFTCGNSQPALGVMYDDRYITRNPHLKAPKAAVDITPTGKHTKLFRISPPEPWRVLRTRLRKTGKFRGSDEGGTPFGFFTGATGITIYRGDAWPKSHWGNAIVGEVANNLVYRALVKPNGVGVTASRADAKAEFLASEELLLAARDGDESLFATADDFLQSNIGKAWCFLFEAMVDGFDDFDTPRRIFEYTIEARPTSAEAYAGLGTVLWHIANKATNQAEKDARRQEAETAFKTAIELHERFAPAHLNLARLHADFGDWRRARTQRRMASGGG